MLKIWKNRENLTEKQINPLVGGESGESGVLKAKNLAEDGPTEREGCCMF